MVRLGVDRWRLLEIPMFSASAVPVTLLASMAFVSEWQAVSSSCAWSLS